mmetsp:Transcript_45579/g.84476  ORF Transcript_45579/g.84476 Transcript_45579/m.84476 type:complete len:373 (+) Transcript_45579:2205-3323(+)
MVLASKLPLGPLRCPPPFCFKSRRLPTGSRTKFIESLNTPFTCRFKLSLLRCLGWCVFLVPVDSFGSSPSDMRASILASSAFSSSVKARGLTVEREAARSLSAAAASAFMGAELAEDTGVTGFETDADEDVGAPHTCCALPPPGNGGGAEALNSEGRHSDWVARWPPGRGGADDVADEGPSPEPSSSNGFFLSTPPPPPPLGAGATMGSNDADRAMVLGGGRFWRGCGEAADDAGVAASFGKSWSNGFCGSTLAAARGGGAVCWGCTCGMAWAVVQVTFAATLRGEEEDADDDEDDEDDDDREFFSGVEYPREREGRTTAEPLLVPAVGRTTLRGEDDEYKEEFVSGAEYPREREGRTTAAELLLLVGRTRL